jgi:hypothetical protein
VGINRFEATEWRHSHSPGRKPRVASNEKPLRSPAGAAIRIPRVVVALLALGSFAAFSSPIHAAGPKIHIVLAAEADPLEKFAADEMAGQLKKLFEAETTIATAAPADAEHVILLGNPATHPLMRPLSQILPGRPVEQEWVHWSLKSGERTHLLVAGGSPRAVLWSVYELGWHFGIRYFTFGDLYPTSPKPFSLDGFQEARKDLVIEGTIDSPTVRVVTMDMSSPIGLAASGAEEQRRYLGQLAKLRTKGLAFDVSREQAVSAAAALRVPVDGDTAGRSAFAGKKYFENPDVAVGADESARRAAAERLQLPVVSPKPRDSRGVLPTIWEFSEVAGGREGFPDAEMFVELLTPVCGEGVSQRVQKAYTELAAAFQKIAANDKALDTIDPQMLLRHFNSDEPPPAWWGEVRTNYLNAMNEMYRANTRAREGGRQFTLWYARRFEFGFEYMNVVEALRKAGIAKRKGNKDEQIAELEKALDSITGACNAIAATARSQSDRGIIAVMNEYGYRPVTKLLEEADAEK